jgi:membrane protease YdiL (CAAX protease family)
MRYLLFWSALYGGIYTLARGLGDIAVSAALLLYAIALLIWVKKRGLSKRLGIIAPKVRGILGYVNCLPLLFFASVNIVERGDFCPSLSSLLLVGAVVTEEIFFRGVLLSAVKKHSSIVAVLISSAVFALFHLVNLIGQTDKILILYTLIFAFSAGVLYASATLYFDSIIPAVFGHYVTNLSASGQNERPSLLFIICIAVCFAWGIALCPLCNRTMKGEQ